jgi:hypothetical protein
LPNSKQTFQDMVRYLFLMGDAHPTGLIVLSYTDCTKITAEIRVCAQGVEDLDIFCLRSLSRVPR